MFTALKVRLYPTEQQRVQLSKEFGCSRFVYNHFLAEGHNTYQDTGLGLSYIKCANQYFASLRIEIAGEYPETSNQGKVIGID